MDKRLVRLVMIDTRSCIPDECSIIADSKEFLSSKDEDTLWVEFNILSSMKKHDKRVKNAYRMTVAPIEVSQIRRLFITTM